MRVFVAGGTGVLGQHLVPQLVARGHQVTATTTSEAKLALAEKLGATGVVMDGLDAESVHRAVARAEPEAIVHQMTAISLTHAGKPEMKHPDRWFAQTIRLRVEGTDHLLAAAEAGASRASSRRATPVGTGSGRAGGSRPRRTRSTRRRGRPSVAARSRSDMWRTWSSTPVARCCVTAGCTGRERSTTR